MSDETIYEIQDVNRRVKHIIERETTDEPFWTVGIISNVHESQRGHMYFDLTTYSYDVPCVLFERRRATIDFTPTAGIEVEVYGTIGVYEKRLTVQIIVENMRITDTHDVDMTPVEQKLRQAGLFPPKKKPFPASITHVALITSKHSEAYHDFSNNYHEVGGTAKIELIDTRIEGEFAAKQIAQSIQSINRRKKHDVIVLTRGGGRQKVLSIFNDFVIAEAICRSSIPIITAIGHEQNTFFADQVADFSRGTPTAAGYFLANHERNTATQPQSPPNILLMILLVLMVLSAIVIAGLILTQS